MELEEAVKLLKHHKKYLQWDSKSIPRRARVKNNALIKAISVVVKEVKEWDTYHYFGAEPLTGKPLKSLHEASKKSGKKATTLKNRK